MKFSNAKKAKMREQRQRELKNYCERRVYSYFNWGKEITFANESYGRYIIDDVKEVDGCYYALCRREEEATQYPKVCFAKFVHAGYVKLILIPKKDFQKNKDFFEGWILKENRKLRYEHKQYVLQVDGTIDVKEITDAVTE